MTKNVSTLTNSELFQKYLEKHKDQVKTESKDGFYHVNIVAEAYTQGFLDGKKTGEKNFVDELIKTEVDKFMRKANQIYILSKELISYLEESSFKVSSLHINLSFQRPSVILAVSPVLLNDDFFTKTAYNKMFDIKEIYLKIFNEYLDMGFVSTNNLDIESLKNEGFGYNERYHEKTKGTRV